MAGGEVAEGLRIKLRHALAGFYLGDCLAEFLEAGNYVLRVGKVVEARFPGVCNESLVDDGCIRIVHWQKLQPQFACEMITVVSTIGVSRAGTERFAFVVFLIRVPAEVIFFFEQQPFLATKEISRGESCDAAADNDDVRPLRRVRPIKLVAIPNLMADREVVALHHWRAALRGWLSQQGFVDRAAGNHGTSDDKLDELTARLRHSSPEDGHQ